MRSRLRIWLGVASALGLVFATGAVGGCFAATELSLVVTTTARCEDHIETEIDTGNRSDVDFGSSPAAVTRECSTAEPRLGTLTIVPTGSRDDQFDVDVVAGVGVAASTCRAKAFKSCIIARRRVSFRPHKALTLPILLSDRCVGVPCDVDRTCDLGVCVPMADCTESGCPRERGDVDAGGPCGHDCLGGACVAGKCQPVVFVEGETQPVGVANDGVELFWTTTRGDVKAKRLDGSGVVRTLASFGTPGLLNADHLEVDGAFVYVAGYGRKQILRLPKAGGAPTVLATCNDDCLGVALRDTTVYFTDRGTNTLRVIEADGGTSNVAIGLSGPEDAFATATDVFIADEHSGKVLRVARTARSAIPTVVARVADPVAVAVDGPDMWVVAQASGIIYRLPVNGTTPAVAVASAPQAVGLTLTPTAIYWAGFADGRIMRLAR